MGCRLIKDSVCRSEEVDALSWFEEVLFYRLITNCDDYGRYDGRAKIVKGSCFPLKDITEKDVDRALGKLAEVGLIIMYQDQDKPYLQLATWEKHQRVRNQRSKYPAYGSDSKLLTFDGKCWQLSATDSDKETAAVMVSKSVVEASEQKIEQVEQAEPAVITLLLNTGQEYPITQSYIAELSALYPAVDVMQEFRTMKGWCDSNPKKRKTAAGIKRFINGWLSKVQNRGGTPGYTQSYAKNTPQSSISQFADMARRWAEDD